MNRGTGRPSRLSLSGQKPLTTWVRNIKTSFNNSFKEAWAKEISQLLQSRSLAQKASHAALLGYCLVGVPVNLKLQERVKARETLGELYIYMFYKGDSEQCASDNAFYADGATLVMRDFSRRGYLLIPQLPSMSSADDDESDESVRNLGSSFEEDKRKQLQKDAWSLLWFSLLAMNTFPLTPTVLTWLLKNAPWLPRHWLLPSQFDQDRLNRFRRARAVMIKGQCKAED